MTSKKVLAANVSAILRYREENELPDASQAAVAHKSRMSGTPVAQTTISNIVRGKGATLDALDALAKALGLKPYQLLIPGLDPHTPFAVPASKEEQAFWARLVRVGTQMRLEGNDESDAKGQADRPSDDRPHDGRERRGRTR